MMPKRDKDIFLALAIVFVPAAGTFAILYFLREYV